MYICPARNGADSKIRKMCMKKILIPLAAVAVALFAVGCDFYDDAQSRTGRLCVSFDESVSYLTKSNLSLPDTSNFLLNITDKSGKVIFDGKFGDCPESMIVSPGSYNIKVLSSEFIKPAFDTPQFGDEQCVVIPNGGSVNVKLLCTQLNCGIGLDVDSDFLTAYPNAVLFLKSVDGKLMYSYRETRMAYFKPGPVSVVMNDSGVDQILMSRDMAARDMLRVRIEVPGSKVPAPSGLSVSVDTSRVWLSGECVIGESYKGEDSEDAFTVAEARASVGEEDVWVSGYIVGGDLTSASASFEPPFESQTCILLGPRSSTVDKSACLSVQLPAGEVREALNLVENPNLLGKKVLLRGDLVEAYYGVPGMKNTSEYQIL